MSQSVRSYPVVSQLPQCQEGGAEVRKKFYARAGGDSIETNCRLGKHPLARIKNPPRAYPPAGLAPDLARAHFSSLGDCNPIGVTL